MPPSRAELRIKVHELVGDYDVATVNDVVADLTAFDGVTEEEALAVLDELEDSGFVYLVELTRGDTEVRVP